jgi:molybdopterin-dependent oxidoreductase alpha subunit
LNGRRRRRIRAIAGAPHAAGPIRIGAPPEDFAYPLAAAWAAWRRLTARQHDVDRRRAACQTPPSIPPGDPSMTPEIDHESGTAIKIEAYDGPVGGWGSASSIAHHVKHHAAFSALPELVRQNKVDGFACSSCAWAKPAKASTAEFCENGAKATFAELTSLRAGIDFFERHTVTELLAWPDHDLEHEGRLTDPLRYDAERDRYVPVAWHEAFADIGARLRALGENGGPDQTVFYASGRASLETSYMYQLFARLYGTNNLPDSSNMCHESTSVALKEAIGVPVGTVRLEDFEHTDCLLFFGQNVGTNSPRMLHPLQEARKRDVPVIVFNPLRERGLEAFTNPQSPIEMATRSETRIATQYLQVRAGGDIAAIAGMCKALLDLDDAAIAKGNPRVIDAAFITQHTHGFEEFAVFVREQDWTRLETESGLSRVALTEAARTYAKAKAAIGVYGMGLTQHKLGVDNVRMLVNLLLMGGHIGKPGAGVCPVRGHSNVQGQRTVGISEKPELVPLDQLAGQYGFEPPRHKGLNTVEACEASSRWAATSSARCPTTTAWSRPGRRSNSRCRSRPSSTAVTCCTAGWPTCCPAWDASSATCSSAACRP